MRLWEIIFPPKLFLSCSNVTLVGLLLVLTQFQYTNGRDCSKVQSSDDTRTTHHVGWRCFHVDHRRANVNRRHHRDAVSFYSGVHVRRGCCHPITTVALLAFDARRASSGSSSGGCATTGRMRRSRCHGAFTAQVSIVPRTATQAAQPTESVAKLRRHQVV